MTNQPDLESIYSELNDLQQKHANLKNKISTKCPECGQVEFKQLFTHAASAIIILNAEGKILLSNHLFFEITGYSQQESYLSHINKILPSKDQHVQNFLENILCESECSANLVFPTINKNNKTIWIDMSVKTLSSGKESQQTTICIFKDVTTEKENESRREELIEELMEVKELQEDNSAQLNLLLHELDDKNLKLKKEISERKKAEQRLRESEERFKNLSITDQLTGLFNRRHMQDVAHKEISRCKQNSSSLCTLIMDVDDFKHLNDTYGHAAGDDVLESIGALIRDSIKDTDQAFRYGGEEFLIFLPDTRCSEAVQTAEKIRTAIASKEYYPCNVAPVQKTISIGIAEYEQGEPLEKMLKRADDNMYQAKIRGKNRVYFSCETGND